MKNLIHFIVITILVSILGACSTTAKHVSLQSASLPKLIPLRDFVANRQSNYGYKISPDGKKVAWIAVSGTKLAVHFKTIGTDKVKVIKNHNGNSAHGFFWGQDSSTLFSHRDINGNENHHVIKKSINTPQAKGIDLTPLKGTKASIVRIPSNNPTQIIIQHNKRDKTVFDLFSLDLKTNQLKLIAKNPGRVTRWSIDDEGKLRGRFRKISDTVTRFETFSATPSTTNEKWTKVMDWDFDDSFYIIGFTKEANTVWAISNINRDKKALYKFNYKTKRKVLVYEEKDIDLENVFISKVTRQPIMSVSMPNYPRTHFFNKATALEFSALKKRLNGNLFITSADYLERTVIIAASSEKTASHYLYQRDSRKLTLLGKHHMANYQAILSSTKPISYKSRDGLTINGYLTIPKGLEGKHNLPMVLQVHGGPWGRDRFGINSHVQFLANRGYAVLQVNYRGSTGYGKKFKNAAIGEFAGKMHTDLIDGVNWAVSKRIADKNKICISGGSYGGYATLVGMTFTPDVFACGVDVVGPSNLYTLLKNTPRYWKNFMPLWHKFVGDPDNPKDRKRMESQSPLFKVNAVKNPLLIVQGANDPRVKQQESDQIVKALRESGKEVEYLLFKDEGHGIRKWTNNLIYKRKLEDFLAKHLGGRSAGFDYFEIGAMIF